MSTQTSILDRLLDPVADCLTPEVARRLADLRAAPATRSRLEELGDKANDGRLTAAEEREYRHYVEALDLIGILQAKARTVLERDGSR